MKSMIRWPGLGIFAVSLLTICLFSLLFVDSIIEKLIEDQGTSLNGAQVELANANLTFFPTGLELHGLQVTNSEKPMQNIVAIDRIACSIDPMKLLQRKIIIDEMAIEGVRPNAPRQRSGAISKNSLRGESGESSQNNGAVKPKEEDKPAAASSLKIPDAKEVLANEKLATLTLNKEYQEQFKADKASWQQKLNELPDKDKFSDYKKQIKKLSSGGFKSIIKNASELKSLKKQIKGDIKHLKTAKNDIEQLTASYRERLKKLKEAPQQDIDRLTNKYAITGTGLANMSSALFGTKVGDTINQALFWYAKAQPMIERAKENNKSEDSVKVPRGKGVDVHFQEQEPLPDFLIRTITASVVMDKGNLAGTINNLTPDQDIAGLPTTFLFQSDSLQGIGSLTIDGILDHIDLDKPSDRVNIEVSDYSITKTVLNDDQGSIPSLNNGLLTLSAQASIKQQNIDANIDAGIKSASFTAPPSEQGDTTSKAIGNALSSITEFSVKAKVIGTLEDYKVHLSSDLDTILQRAVADRLKAETEKFKNDLKVLVLEQTKQPLSDTESELDGIDSIAKDLRDRLNISEKLL